MKHIEYQIPPIAHTPMYNWHKFWSRKTWNVVSEFVKAYCPEGGIVIDPFSGSGVTALEALRNNRRAIAIDINPIATSILKATVEFVPENAILDAFAKIEKAVRPKVESMYETKCRSCGALIEARCFVWKRPLIGNEKLDEVRYVCPQCGDERRKNTAASRLDKERVLEATECLRSSGIWYPTQQLEYTDGQPFKERQRFRSVDELFTDRALYSLGLLHAEIAKVGDQSLRSLLLMAFSSMAHLCSKMCPISEAGHFTPYSSAWIQHSYWFAKVYMEQNVWEKFESAVTGHQGIVKAKAESNPLFRNKTITTDPEDFLKRGKDLLIVTDSALDSLRDLRQLGVNCDYCFTDPPYDSSIQYGELAFMWACWLKKDEGYLERIATDEVIRNDRQHKDFERYHAMLSATFKEIQGILKPSSFMTVTFHNPTFKVRNATIRAAVFSGFEFQKIHHQELARPSAKSLLQPFGSANGDYYLRFQKLPVGHDGKGSKSLDETRFRTVVIETTKKLLAERWEPTPYTVIINYIDPVLAREGFFHELYPGFDVKTVLQNSLDDVFVLVPTKIGSAAGECWWFRDPGIIKHHEIPLSERVEQCVVCLLSSRYKVDYTDIWRTVNLEFPNSLTTDSTSIIETLKEYAEKTAGGEWVLMSTFKQRESEHSQLVAQLADLGGALGCEVWIGKREQSDSYRTAQGDRKLRTLVTCKDITVLPYSGKVLKDVCNIDVLWIRNGVVNSIFEVENTTSVTSALKRGSHIEGTIGRYILLPDERYALLERKLKMPMFSERFRKDGWKIIYYDYFKLKYNDLKNMKLRLSSLESLPVSSSGQTRKGSKKDQMQLTL